MKPPPYDKWSGFTDAEFELVQRKREDLTPEEDDTRVKAIERVTASLPPFTRTLPKVNYRKLMR